MITREGRSPSVSRFTLDMRPILAHAFYIMTLLVMSAVSREENLFLCH